MKPLSERVAALSPEQRALLTQRLGGKGVAAPGLGSIPRRATSGPAPLSFAQQRLWFLQRLEPASAAYNMPLSLRLRGPLDVGTLQRTLQFLVGRHEVLRTRIAEVEEGPRQIVAQHLHLPLPVTGVEHIPASEREEEVRRLASREARTPFDPAQGPLIRARLLRLAEEEHVLLLTLHHIVSDGWSMGVLFRELADVYEAVGAGRPVPLADLPVQYSDYAAWQRERLANGTLDGELEYWKRQLEGAPPVLELPTDFPRPAVPSHRGGGESIVLPAELAGALKALSRGEGVTLFMTLLAALQVVLGRWAAQEDVIVGTPIAGRIRSELEGLIGCFLNTLVLRTSLAGKPTFRELLGRVREVALGAYSHQELPFERLVEVLHPERSLSHNPLFQVLFQVENERQNRRRLHGLEVTSLGGSGKSAKFDLSIRVRQRDGQLHCSCAFSTDLFTGETIAHLLDQFKALLEQIVAAPDSSIESYSLVTDRSRALLPDPAQALPAPAFAPVTETFAAVVRSAPERVAIAQGDRHWTYGELDAAAALVASALRGRGLPAGAIVALTGPPSFGLYAGMIGVLRAGGVLLPIGEDLPDRRKGLMAEQAGAKYLLCVARGEARALPEGLADLDVVLVGEDTGRPDLPAADLAAPAPPPAPVPGPDDPAYVFYTSGTTGTPKGVLGVHKALSHFLAWQRETFGLGPEDRCAQLTNISFDVILRDVFLPLTSGATLCLPPHGLTPDQVLGWLAAERVTLVHVVPSLARTWLDHPEPGRPLSALRWVFLAGEPLTDVLIARWREVVPPGCGLVNLYGPTETTMVKSFYRVPAEVLPGVQPVGRPLPATQLLVLGRDDRRCGVNEPGEIVVRTPFRTLGYINAPQEQARRFVVNPYRQDAGDVLYRTGDVGRYRPDGTLLVMARLDHQIKIRGVRIEPDEVTAVLSQHPGVRACAVVGRENGDRTPVLVAYVVGHSDGVTAPGMRAYLAERLPAPLIPSAFVLLDQLPLTPNGKLDRRALPAPESSRPDAQRAYAAPRTPVEELLAAIWAEVLRVERVGVQDDFFELGGHSLLATQVVARVRAATGVELPLRSLFECPTVAALAVNVVRRLLETMQNGAVGDPAAPALPEGV